jgi:hypothetical protein
VTGAAEVSFAGLTVGIILGAREGAAVKGEADSFVGLIAGCLVGGREEAPVEDGKVVTSGGITAGFLLGARDGRAVGDNVGLLCVVFAGLGGAVTGCVGSIVVRPFVQSITRSRI